MDKSPQNCSKEIEGSPLKECVLLASVYLNVSPSAFHDFWNFRKRFKDGILDLAVLARGL